MLVQQRLTADNSDSSAVPFTYPQSDNALTIQFSHYEKQSYFSSVKPDLGVTSEADPQKLQNDSTCRRADWRSHPSGGASSLFVGRFSIRSAGKKMCVVLRRDITHVSSQGNESYGLGAARSYRLAKGSILSLDRGSILRLDIMMSHFS
jgi:hypothetical protein